MFRLDHQTQRFGPWVTFAGCVLIIFVLSWAQAMFVPFALAMLLTFILEPPVAVLQRWLGRTTAVLVVVTLVFTVLGAAAWGTLREMNHFIEEVPQYRTNIRAKIRDIRGVSTESAVEKLQRTIEGIKTDLGQDAPSKPPPTSVVIAPTEEASVFDGVGWLTTIASPASTAGFVIVLVIFTLLERRDLRDRLIGLIGHGQVAVTTRALDEASSRVSRQLLMQSLTNLLYGLAAGTGLYLLGVPYPLLWAALGGALRFIPYVGPTIGAVVPILVSVAALEGWVRPMWVAAFFLVLELFTNLVLETALAAGTAGVSQVALLVSIAFWTWLWGPLGLLMATPLTVCVVVLGKHVPGLEIMGRLLADTPPLAAEYGYYQRLLARDHSEAADLIEQHIATEPTQSVYDALLLPALNYAERDRMEQRLSAEEETAIFDATRDLVPDARDAIRRLRASATDPLTSAPSIGEIDPLHVFAYAVNGPSDELALSMLTVELEGVPVTIETGKPHTLAGELIAQVKEHNYAVVCIADLPPSSPSKTRYLVKRLKAACPDVKIAVGRWAPITMADETVQPLRDAGADHVASTLVETRTFLEGLCTERTFEKMAG